MRIVVKRIAQLLGLAQPFVASKSLPTPRRRQPVGIELLEDRFAPAQLTVNTLLDGPANSADGVLSLREAVETVTAGFTTGRSAGERAQISGTLGDNDLIVFSDALTAAGPATISLTAGELTLAAPDFAIRGPGQQRLTIERSSVAPGPFRIFTVYQNVIASITDLTIARGAPAADQSGGGILNAGQLTVQNVDFIGNVAAGAGGGGAIENSFVLSALNCTFTSNSSSYGGALDEDNGSAVSIIGNCTFNNNSAGSGGAVYLDGTAVITNSTFSGNSTTTNGGALRNNGVLTLVNCTVTGNRADSNGANTSAGGGIKTSLGKTTTLYNTIIAGNLLGSGAGVPSDLETGVNVAAASANNIIGNASSAGGLSNGTNGNIVGNSGAGTIPLASILNTTLAGNGGPTKTHALVQNSIALGAGKASVPGFANHDQRDAARDPGNPDIGAYEVQHPLAPVGVPSNAGRTFAPQPSPNAVTAFVKGLYQSTLLRAADAAGLNYWVSLLNQGMSREQVARGFYNSYENRFNQVSFFYRYFLRREPELDGLNFHVARLQSGIDEGAVMTDFVLSPEFAGQNDNASFVNLMYYALLSRQAEANGFAYWKSALDNGSMTRADEVYGFLRSAESIGRIVSADFISYLKHAADSASLSDNIASIQNGATFGSLAIKLLGSAEFYGLAGANLQNSSV